MAYRTHCDWCGEYLGYEADQAELRITIYHRGGKSTLDAKWAEETDVTRHFCAAPKDDTDRHGRNRMGLAPDENPDSCYGRALAAVTGTRVSDPGLGMEWRLMPIEAVETAPRVTSRVEATRVPNVLPSDAWRDQLLAEREEWRKARAAWAVMSEGSHRHLVLEVIGDGRVTITEVWEAIHGKGEGFDIYRSDIVPLIARMLRDGELERAPENYRNKVRYRYFPKPIEPVLKTPAQGDAPAGGA